MFLEFLGTTSDHVWSFAQPATKPRSSSESHHPENHLLGTAADCGSAARTRIQRHMAQVSCVFSHKGPTVFFPYTTNMKNQWQICYSISHY